MENVREWVEECGVCVGKELAQVSAVFLRLEDRAEGVDVGDAVCCYEGAVEDDVVVCVVFRVMGPVAWVLARGEHARACGNVFSSGTKSV